MVNLTGKLRTGFDFLEWVNITRIKKLRKKIPGLNPSEPQSNRELVNVLSKKHRDAQVRILTEMATSDRGIAYKSTGELPSSGWKERQLEFVRSQKEDSHNVGRHIASTLSTIVGIGSLVLGASKLAYFGTNSNNNPNEQNASVVESHQVKLQETLETITFEDAKFEQDPQLRDEYRQLYLDRVFQDKNGQYSLEIPGWQSFAGFDYDPGMKKALENTDGADERSQIEGYSNDISEAIMMTPRLLPSDSKFNVEGSKSIVYVNSVAFDRGSNNEEEFLSNLDNEAYHAFLTEKGRSPYTMYIVKEEPSPEMFFLMQEALSYEHQFLQIQNGKRDVPESTIRRRYGRMWIINAVERAYKMDGDEAKVDRSHAYALLKTFADRGTLRYFKLPAE